MPNPTPEDLAKFTGGLAQVLDLMKMAAEAVDGYRAQCIERGYSPTAAEKMAMDFHGQLIIAVFK